MLVMCLQLIKDNSDYILYDTSTSIINGGRDIVHHLCMYGHSRFLLSCGLDVGGQK